MSRTHKLKSDCLSVAKRTLTGLFMIWPFSLSNVFYFLSLHMFTTTLIYTVKLQIKLQKRRVKSHKNVTNQPKQTNQTNQPTKTNNKPKQMTNQTNQPKQTTNQPTHDKPSQNKRQTKTNDKPTQQTQTNNKPI